MHSTFECSEKQETHAFVIHSCWEHASLNMSFQDIAETMIPFSQIPRVWKGFNSFYPFIVASFRNLPEGRLLLLLISLFLFGEPKPFLLLLLRLRRRFHQMLARHRQVLARHSQDACAEPRGCTWMGLLGKGQSLVTPAKALSPAAASKGSLWKALSPMPPLSPNANQA